MSAMQRTDVRVPASDRVLDAPWKSLREANFLLRERGFRALQAHGLTYSEFVVLDLGRRGPAKASDVARALGLTPAGGTDVIDRLEARRLVRRVPDPNDRRVVLIQNTAAGEKLRLQGGAVKEGILRYLTGAMTAAERQALATGLDALLRALRDAPDEV